MVNSTLYYIIETNVTIDAFNFFILKFFIKIFLKNAKNFPSCQTDELNCGKVDNPDVVKGAKQMLISPM